MNNKGITKTGLIIIVVIIAVILGYLILTNYTTTNPNTKKTSQPPPANNLTPKSVAIKKTPQNKVNGCDLIGNSSFESIKKYDGGLGPDGPVMAYWNIQFEKNINPSGKPIFRWQHSNIIETGTYTCSNNILQLELNNRLRKRTATAQYDENKKILIFDDIEYKKVDQ